MSEYVCVTWGVQMGFGGSQTPSSCSGPPTPVNSLHTKTHSKATFTGATKKKKKTELLKTERPFLWVLTEETENSVLCTPGTGVVA